jgi:hypothetical protein
MSESSPFDPKSLLPQLLDLSSDCLPDDPAKLVPLLAEVRWQARVAQRLSFFDRIAVLEWRERQIVDKLSRLPSQAQHATEGDGDKRRVKKGEAYILIIAAFQSLADKGDWNATDEDIISLAGVKRSTYYDVLNKNELARHAKEAYRAQRLGRGPERAGGY